MYTSGRTVKSTARKLNTGLTVQTATRDARRIAERVMPGVGVTVTSRIGWDTESDRETVVTTVTFPRTWNHANLGEALGALSGVIASIWADSSIVITRTVK